MDEMDEARENMEFFDQKVVRIFREELPAMPELPEMKELDMETLDQLQAAGDSICAADIVRFLKGKNKTGGAL